MKRLRDYLAAPLNWLAQWTLLLGALLAVPACPHWAFHRIREKDFCFWAGFAAYASSAVLGVWKLRNIADPAEIPVWTRYYHPVETIVFSASLDRFVTLAPVLRYLFLSMLVVVDVLAVALVVAVVVSLAEGVLEERVSMRKLTASAFLLLGVLSLEAFLLMSRFTFLPPLAPTEGIATLAAALMFYGWIALVVAGGMTVPDALHLVVVTLFFFSMGLAGFLLRMAAKPIRWLRPKQVSWSMHGLMLSPVKTFRTLADSSPLRSAAISYFVVTVTLLALWRYSVAGEHSFLKSIEVLAVFQEMWVFNRSLLVLCWFLLGFADLSSFSQTAPLLRNLPWYGYVYLVIAAAAARYTFLASTYFRLKKLHNTPGSGGLRAWLSACQWISITTGVCATGVGLLAWALSGHNPSENTLGYTTLLFGWALGLAGFQILVWWIRSQVVLIRELFHVSAWRAFGSWLTSVLLFAPLTIATVLYGALKEIVRPLQVARLARRLEGQRNLVLFWLLRGEIERAVKTAEELFLRCGQTDPITRRARRGLNIGQLLAKMFEASQQDALRFILDLSRHAEHKLREEARDGLAAILDARPDVAVPIYLRLLAKGCPPDLLEGLTGLPDPSGAKALGVMFHQLAFLTTEENLGERLTLAKSVFSAWRGQPNGEELYLVYRALATLAVAANVTDLERASEEVIGATNASQSLLSRTVAFFRPLVDICQYLAYYSRTDFENKLPYLAAPIMILVDQARQLDKLSFPPEDRLLRLLIQKLQGIVLREFDGLRGRADLRCELKPARVRFEPTVSLQLLIRNQGSAVAEKLNLALVNGNRAGDGFSVDGAPACKVDLLPPKKEARLEFAIRPQEPGRVRLAFEITYDDLEKKGRAIGYTALTDFFDAAAPQLAAPEDTFRNPYITGSPVMVPEMFFGREDVFKFIGEHLDGKYQKNNIVLRGQRRTGKSSILYQLSRRLDPKYIPVLLDMQGFVDRGPDRFLFWIARGITRAITERGFAVQTPVASDFSQNPYSDFRDVFLPRMFEALGYHHLLLAFDEFEEIAARVESGKLEADVLPYLRSLMQHTPQLHFLFAGTHKLQEITHEYWSILFNIALFKDIGLMSPEVVAQIVRNPVKGVIFYDDLAVEKIARITAGHPYFVQMVGNKMVDYYLNERKFYMTLQDVNQVLDDVIIGGSLHFDYLWRDSSPTEQLLVTAMARVITREGGAVSLGEVETLFSQYDLGISRADIVEAARSLTVRELLSADADFRHFEFKIDLVRLWLMRYQKFAVAAETFQEEFRARRAAKSVG